MDLSIAGMYIQRQPAYLHVRGVTAAATAAGSCPFVFKSSFLIQKSSLFATKSIILNGKSIDFHANGCHCPCIWIDVNDYRHGIAVQHGCTGPAIATNHSLMAPQGNILEKRVQKCGAGVGGREVGAFVLTETA